MKFILALVFLVLLGSGLYWFSSGPAEFDLPESSTYDGDVIVVGAGSSGLTAAYLLERQGVNVTVIEAQDVYGGRMREASDFADFPIDLGAEWIHEDPAILEAIVSDDNVSVDVETITYNPRDVYEWDGELTKDTSIEAQLYSEYKFKDTTWFSFFDTYIVPSIKDRIVLSEPVASIDYTGDKITVSTVDNKTFQPANTYTADRVIVTVPMTVLQNNYITFDPALDESRTDAINSITVPEGIKVFVEFSEKFYPDVLSFPEFSDDNTGEEKIYYDAAFKKDTDRHILGLFTIGRGAEQLVELEDEEIISRILAELDEIYDGKASETYVNHVIQNWSSNQFISGSYSTEFLENRRDTIETIAEPIQNRVYFAGEALSINNQATVPGAAETGFDAVKLLLENQ